MGKGSEKKKGAISSINYILTDKKEEILEKLERMLKVSTKVNLERMLNILDIDKKSFDNKIFEWAEKCDFTIDGENLVVNQNKILEFIDVINEEIEDLINGFIVDLKYNLNKIPLSFLNSLRWFDDISFRGISRYYNT